MKKKVLSVMLVTAMLLSSTAAFAENAVPVDSDITISRAEQSDVQPSFVKDENLKVTGIENGTLMTTDKNGETVYIHTNKAVVYTSNGTELTVADIKEGDSLTIFTRANEPTPAIVPPVYTPAVIIVNEETSMAVTVSNFRRNPDGDGYINTEKDLVIHMPEGFQENKKADNDYIVFYTIVTQTIPPQTTPDKLVLLEETPDAEITKPEDQDTTPAFAKNENLKFDSIEDNQIKTTTADDQTLYLNFSGAVFYDNDGTEIKAEDLKQGDVLTAYSRSNSPALLSLPPIYYPAVIIRQKADYAGSVTVSNFRRNPDGDGYINTEKDLVIHMPEGFPENKKADNDYIVFYTMTTYSIPPQTTPDKLVLLEENYEEDQQFEDVQEDNPFYDSIGKAVEKGLFKGVSEKLFSPETAMTRAMFVTVLGRLDGIAVKDACVTGFSDTPGDEYYSSYVAWANENNIVKGFEDNTFKPNQNVSREEAMQILYNYCQYKGIGPVGEWAVNITYADTDKVADYASSACMWNVINQYLVPDSNNQIRPKEDASRAEIAHAMDVLSGQLSK